MNFSTSIFHILQKCDDFRAFQSILYTGKPRPLKKPSTSSESKLQQSAQPEKSPEKKRTGGKVKRSSSSVFRKKGKPPLKIIFKNTPVTRRPYTATSLPNTPISMACDKLPTLQTEEQDAEQNRNQGTAFVRSAINTLPPQLARSKINADAGDKGRLLDIPILVLEIDWIFHGAYRVR